MTILCRPHYITVVKSNLMELGPSSVILDPHLSPVAEETLTACRVVTHDGRVVEWGEALAISVIGRGSIGQQNLRSGEVIIMGVDVKLRMG